MKDISLYLHTDSSFKLVENIEELVITQNVNDHGYLRLTAILQEEANTEYATTIQAFESIEVVTQNNTYETEDGTGESENSTNETVTIFRGIIQNITVKHINKQYYLSVLAATGTYRADIELRSRSFQDKTLSYKAVVENVIKEYQGGDFNDCATDGAIKDNFLMQYRETDWEFIKRIASTFNATLVASLVFSTPKLYVGRPIGTSRGEIEKYNFYVEKDLERYLRESNNKNKKLTALDTVTFYIEIYENFDIGDKMTYYEKASDKLYVDLFIKSKKIEMVNGTLRYTYGLSTEGGLTTEKIYNQKIAGVSLKGEVLERIEDRVKVHLEIDDKQDVETAWEFQYSTLYAAEGNSGFYMMPEIGDTVFINFTNNNEESGVGVNSVRVKNVGSDKIENPEIKYLRTKDGKEIKLAPDELVITCSNWKNEETGEEKKIYIQLSDKGGITIQSTEPIYINSEGDVQITADKQIIIAAEEEIKLRCKSGSVKLGSSIELDGAPVRIN